MNLKEKLIKYRDTLMKSITKKPSFSDNYMKTINDFIESTKLTEEQFEFIKKSYLQDDKIVGLHNTFYGDVDSFKENKEFLKNFRITCLELYRNI